MPGQDWLVGLCFKVIVMVNLMVGYVSGWWASHTGRTIRPKNGGRRLNCLGFALLFWCMGCARGEEEARRLHFSENHLHGDEGPTIRTFKEIGWAAVDMVERVTQAQGLGDGMRQHGIAPGDGQELPGGGPIITGQNADVLLQMGGDRNLLIFRPNPYDVHRPERLRLFVGAHDTVESILQQVMNHWTDLNVINWELMSVNDRIQTSLELQQGDYCLLVWTPQDLFGANSGVIMMELQVWNVVGGTVVTSLHPFTIWKESSANEFLDSVGLGGVCAFSPCPIRQDGDLVLYGDRLRLYDADYVVVMRIEDGENVRVVIYDPTVSELPVLERIPTDFEDHVRRQSTHHGLLRAEDYALEAWKFSWSITTDARRLFERKRMLLTQGRDLYVFPCRHAPADFREVKHAALRDPFSLLYTLKEKGLIDEDIPWAMLEVHPAVMRSTISRFGKAMGILEEGGHDIAREVFILLEKILTPRGSPQETYRNHMSLWMDKDFEISDFLRQQGMWALCQIHFCIVFVNGERIYPFDRVQLENGAFLQTEIQLNTEINRGEAKDSIEEDQDSDEERQPSQKRQKHDSYAGGNKSGEEGGGIHPPPGLGISMTGCIWLWSKVVGVMCWPSWLTSVVVRPISCTVRGGSVRFKLWILLSVILLGPVGGLQFTPVMKRIGEAPHPGPNEDTSTVWLRTSQTLVAYGVKSSLEPCPMAFGTSVRRTYLRWANAHHASRFAISAERAPGICTFYVELQRH